MSAKRPLVILLVVFVALLTVFLMTQNPDPSRANAVAAPDIDLPLTPNASPVKLSSLKGKVVILDFWATWCGPCQMSIPELEKLHEKYKAQGLQVVGVSADAPETQANIPTVQKSLGMTYPVVIAEKIPDIRDKFPADSLPTLYLIDKEGKVRRRDSGFSSEQMHNVDVEVQALLKE